MPVRAHLSVAILVFGLILAGCDRDDKIVVYTTPKDMPRTAPNSPSPTPAMTPTPAMDASKPGSAQGELQWTTPQGWKELPGDGQMRYASFQVVADHPEIELSVIPLGPEAADLLPNVTRWQGQVGLPPSGMGDLPNVVKRVTVGNLNFDTVDLVGPETANPRLRMLAAILAQPDKTWFFKLLGPADLIAPQAANFQAFIQSIHVGTGAAKSVGGAPMANTPPMSPTPTTPPMASTGGTSSGAGGATWVVPGTWEAEPDKPMRLASFKAGDAELIITQFGKDNIGGALDNINRWRGQAGVAPITDEKEANALAVNVNGKDGAVFDFSGPQSEPNPKRVRVAMIYDGEQVWFFKLVGPASAVAQQQPAFDSFLKSVKFGGNQ